MLGSVSNSGTPWPFGPECPHDRYQCITWQPSPSAAQEFQDPLYWWMKDIDTTSAAWKGIAAYDFETKGLLEIVYRKYVDVPRFKSGISIISV